MKYKLTPLLSELTAHLVSHLRRGYRYSPVKRAIKSVSVSSCSKCGKGGVIDYDHTDPVVPLNSSAREMHPVDYFMRLFCIDPVTGDISLDNLAPLCVGCHKKKSAEEKKIRAKNKRDRGWKPVRKKKRRLTCRKRKRNSK